MAQNELIAKLKEIDSQISTLDSQRKELVWQEGVPAIIAKMKEMGKSVIELREAEDYFDHVEDLWGCFEDGYFAVKKIKLNEEGELIAVYSTLWNNEGSYESNWDYDDEDMETVVDKRFSNSILTKIISNLLTDDRIYDVVAPDEDEQENEDFVIDGKADDLKLMFGNNENSIDLEALLAVAKNKEFRKEIYSLVSQHLNKEHFTIAIGVEEDELIFRCKKQFDDDESFDHLASVMTKYFGQTLPFYSINDLDFIEEEPELLASVTDDISTWVNDWDTRVVIYF